MQQTKNRVSGVRPEQAFTHPSTFIPEPDWRTAATVENAALASVALEEELNPERLIEAAYALSVSPMFVTLCNDFASRKRKQQSGEQRSFEVRLFAARMFLAGLRSERTAA